MKVEIIKSNLFSWYSDHIGKILKVKEHLGIIYPNDAFDEKGDLIYPNLKINRDDCRIIKDNQLELFRDYIEINDNRLFAHSRGAKRAIDSATEEEKRIFILKTEK